MEKKFEVRLTAMGFPGECHILFRDNDSDKPMAVTSLSLTKADIIGLVNALNSFTQLHPHGAKEQDTYRIILDGRGVRVRSAKGT